MLRKLWVDFKSNVSISFLSQVSLLSVIKTSVLVVTEKLQNTFWYLQRADWPEFTSLCSFETFQLLLCVFQTARYCECIVEAPRATGGFRCLCATGHWQPQHGGGEGLWRTFWTLTLANAWRRKSNSNLIIWVSSSELDLSQRKHIYFSCPVLVGSNHFFFQLFCKNYGNMLSVYKMKSKVQPLLVTGLTWISSWISL